MEGSASVYRGVGDIQERENNQMVSVLSQAKDPDLTLAENAAKMTALLERLSCWNNEAVFKICDIVVEDDDVVLYRNFHNNLCDKPAILEEFDHEYERCDTVEGMFDPREYLEVIGLQDQDVLDLLQDHILDDADAYVKLEEVKMPLRVV